MATKHQTVSNYVTHVSEWMRGAKEMKELRIRDLARKP